MSGRRTIEKAEKPVPAFLNKLYEIVGDPATNHLISWSPHPAGLNAPSGFIVHNTEQFAQEVLPLHFKTSRFSSFVRQLNLYGFHKLGTDSSNRCEFVHDRFRQGDPDTLKEIKRKSADGALKGRLEVVERDREHVHDEVYLLRGEMQQQIGSLKNDNRQLSIRLDQTQQQLAATQADVHRLAYVLQMLCARAAVTSAPSITPAGWAGSSPSSDTQITPYYPQSYPWHSFLPADAGGYGSNPISNRVSSSTFNPNLSSSPSYPSVSSPQSPPSSPPLVAPSSPAPFMPTTPPMPSFSGEDSLSLDMAGIGKKRRRTASPVNLDIARLLMEDSLPPSNMESFDEVVCNPGLGRMGTLNMEVDATKPNFESEPLPSLSFSSDKTSGSLNVDDVIASFASAATAALPAAILSQARISSKFPTNSFVLAH